MKTTKEIELIEVALLNNTSPNILDEPILKQCWRNFCSMT